MIFFSDNLFDRHDTGRKLWKKYPLGGKKKPERQKYNATDTSTEANKRKTFKPFLYSRE